MPRRPKAETRPTLAIVASTILWGTLWIPLRHLDEVGLGGAWASAGGFFLPLLFLAPIAARRRRAIGAGGVPLWAGGLLLAIAIALYAEALLRGHVARVMLLFYLTPIWGTLLARLMLGEPITRWRVVTVVLGLSGMAVVLGRMLPVPSTAAEWMGLASGFCWAWAMVYVNRAKEASELDQIFVLFLFLAPALLALALVPGGRAWTLPTRQMLLDALGWMIAFGALWMPAVIWLTMFGGSRIEPGRVAVLLTLEVVIGLVSAVLLTDEPFGAREVVGAILIVGAGALELYPAETRCAAA